MLGELVRSTTYLVPYRGPCCQFTWYSVQNYPSFAAALLNGPSTNSLNHILRQSEKPFEPGKERCADPTPHSLSAMPLDSLSYTSISRIRALVVPIGRIKRSRFLQFFEQLSHHNVVRLGDVTPDRRPDRSEEAPRSDGGLCR